MEEIVGKFFLVVPIEVLQKKIYFYVLQTQLDQEGIPDVVPGTLKLFHLDAYDLINPDASLSFLTPWVAMRFDVSLDVLIKPFCH